MSKKEDDLLDAQFEQLVNLRVEEKLAAKAFSTPVNRPPFSGAPFKGYMGELSDDKAPKNRNYGMALKHIDLGDSRRENEELAYRFFKWFSAVSLPTNTAVQRDALKFCEEHGIPTIKALNEGVNEQGGSLVPQEFDAVLIRLIERYGVFRQFTRISPMASDLKSVPRRTGGVTANWVGEGKTITASNPTFDNIQLVAKKLAALTVMSSEITEDSAINIADELAFEIGYAFALAEDQAGFLGDGSPTYGNIWGITQKLKLLDTTIANIAGLRVASGNLFSEFVLDDFIQTVALLPQYADTQAAGWFCNRSFYYGTMQKLELTVPGGVEAREVSAGDRRARPLFLGYPVNFTQVMPRADANSQIPVLLGDLAMASVMGDRRARTLFTDPYSLSNSDQIQVRGTERIDIDFFDTGNASATAALRQAGSIVGLISAAS
jgi:HK97 family phage major capsid protein